MKAPTLYGKAYQVLDLTNDENKIIKFINEAQTSEEWQSIFPYPKVLDPDGWDRKNYDYSWKEEKITLEEYEARRSQSTCVYSIITERMFEKGVD